MTVSKESLLDDGHDRIKLSTSLPTQQQQPSNEHSINPMLVQQRRHNEAVHDGAPEMQLSHTMRFTDSNTMVIYYSASVGARSPRHHYYTEIPFAAIHGMQTRPIDELNGIQDHDKRDDTEDTQSTTITWPLLIATMANSISQFLVGYNIAILNTTESFIFPNHTTLAWSWAVAALAIGAPFGAMLGGHISDSFGRKAALIFNAIGFLIGGILQALAPNLRFLTLSRFLLGIQSGVATVLVPIYLGELAPPKLRGSLGTVNQFAFVVGILVADILSFPFANDADWRYLLALTPVVALIQLLMMPWVVQSPRYLLHRNPRDLQARAILKGLRGHKNDEDVEEEVDTFVAVVMDLCSPSPRKPRTKAFDDAEAPSGLVKENRPHQQPEGIFREILTFPNIRFLFFCCVLLHVGQQLCGVNAVFYYSTSLFEDHIKNPLYGTTSIGAINVIFTYVALLLMDSRRRKTLVLWSIGGMILSCTGLILCQMGVIRGNGIPAVLFVNLYVAFYAIGFGPIPFLWIAEMVEPRYVALVMTICSQINWVTNFLVGLLFPSMKAFLGGFTFVPFGVVLLVSFVFVWQVLPEKKPITVNDAPR